MDTDPPCDAAPAKFGVTANRGGEGQPVTGHNDSRTQGAGSHYGSDMTRWYGQVPKCIIFIVYLTHAPLHSTPEKPSRTVREVARLLLRNRLCNPKDACLPVCYHHAVVRMASPRKVSEISLCAGLRISLLDTPRVCGVQSQRLREGGHIIITQAVTVVVPGIVAHDPRCRTRHRTGKFPTTPRA